jgi:TPR repeat protein
MTTHLEYAEHFETAKRLFLSDDPSDIAQGFRKFILEIMPFETSSGRGASFSFLKENRQNKFAMLQSTLTDAVGNGDVEAMLMMGATYHIAGDDINAYKYFKKSADQGDSRAQNKVGFFHEHGCGGAEKSDIIAYKYYKKSADQGYSNAQNNVGVFHEHGCGGAEKSAVIAYDYFKKSADQGNSTAQNNLGVFHELGRGGAKKSAVIAYDYFKKSADQGYLRAQYAIQRMDTKRRVADQNKPTITPAPSPRTALVVPVVTASASAFFSSARPTTQPTLQQKYYTLQQQHKELQEKHSKLENNHRLLLEKEARSDIVNRNISAARQHYPNMLATLAATAELHTTKGKKRTNSSIIEAKDNQETSLSKRVKHTNPPSITRQIRGMG